jgi:hypothetical protein
MIRRDLLSLGVLLTAGGLASTLPSGEADAASRPGLLFQSDGTYETKSHGNGSLHAAVLIQRIAVNSSSRALSVQGRIAGRSGSGGFEGFTSQSFTAKAKLTSAEAGGKSCGELTLEIHSIHLNIRGGLTINLDPVKLDATDLSNGARKLANELCLLAAALDGKGSSTSLERLVNEINKTLASELIVIPQA